MKKHEKRKIFVKAQYLGFLFETQSFSFGVLEPHPPSTYPRSLNFTELVTHEIMHDVVDGVVTSVTGEQNDL